MTDASITIIKAGTGIGKSEELIKLDNAVIGCPTHELKNELILRARKIGKKFISSPQLKLPNIEHQKEYERRQSIGAFQSANQYLRKLADEKNVKEADDYLTQLSEMKNLKDKPIITTHKRIL